MSVPDVLLAATLRRIDFHIGARYCDVIVESGLAVDQGDRWAALMLRNLAALVDGAQEVIALLTAYGATYTIASSFDLAEAQHIDPSDLGDRYGPAHVEALRTIMGRS